MSSIRLQVTVKKETFYPGNGRRKVQHKASAGALSASADSEAEAKAQLQALAERACEVENAIVILYSILDSSEVWIATGDAHGWAYRIVRPREPSSHYARETFIGGNWTKDECLDHMRSHWYDCNAGEVVAGIVALAGWARVTCKRCQTTGPLAHRPSKCVNPACGAVL